jgi:hypothetical protein
MQHCIGNGAYDRHLGKSDREFLSLRDEHKKPHATLEIHKDRVIQISGKQNRRPLEKYLQKLLPYMQERKLIPYDSGHCGYVVGKDLCWYPLNNMPSGSTFFGPLRTVDHGISFLPSNFTIDGMCILSQSDVKELPENLSVKGHLMCSAPAPFRHIPRDITVNGDLILDNSPVDEFPPSGLNVSGLISLCHSKIERLPDNLKIKGSLHLNGCKLSAVPTGLSVNGDLFLDSTLIQSLPGDLNVAGSLSLARTKVTSIPDTVVIGGDLDCTLSDVISLPEKRHIKGHLLLTGTNIRELPIGLSVGRSLDLRDTPIETLPSGLAVGTLRLPSTVKTLPDDLVVRTCLDLTEASIIDVPDSVSSQCVIKLSDGYLSMDDYRKYQRGTTVTIQMRR